MKRNKKTPFKARKKNVSFKQEKCGVNHKSRLIVFKNCLPPPTFEFFKFFVGF